MKRDFQNIRGLFKMGLILGMTPMWKAKSRLIYKLYILILTVLSIFGTALSLNSRYQALSDDLDMNLAQAFLESCECLIELLFLLTCFLGMIRKEDNWKTLFYSLGSAEEKLHYLDFKEDTSTCRYILELCLFHIIFVFIHAYEILVFLPVQDISTEYGYILYRIIMYYQFFMIYTIVSINNVLKKRYMFLDKLIEEVLKEKGKVVTISVKENQRTLIQLHKIQKVYGLLYTGVTQINTIFGWRIFFNFCTYVLIILGNLNYVLKYTQTADSEFNTAVFLNYVLYSIVYTISTIAIVMSCNGVEESGRKIVKTCFLYQEILEKPSLRHELVLFAKFTKQLAPTFSAAGFFEINQAVLSTLFTAVITYLIIILQFNMTL